MADLSLISDAAWREAQRRAEVIRPLAELERRPRHLVLAAAAALGLAERQTYTLIHRCLDAGGELTALLPGRSNGGRARPRVETAGEAVLREIIRELYLKPQKANCGQRSYPRSPAGAPPRNCVHHHPPPFAAASRRCLSLIYDAAARSIRKRSRCTGMPRLPDTRWTSCRWITRPWT